jgi:uncharacterized protein (DUF58 family)
MILPSRRWYLGAAALAAIAPLALVWPGAAVAWFAADMAWVAALLVDGWRIGAVDIPRFPVRRDAPPAFSVGRPLPVRYLWRNPSPHLLRVVVRETFAPGLVADARQRALRLPGASEVEETLRMHPVHRGKTAAGRLDIRLRGPWGLLWRQGRCELPWDVTVYPGLRTAALRALPSQAQRRREAGFRNLRRVGEGRLFESLKEWVPGDETRSIDWKATARRGKLMARRYEDERRQHVMMLIDAGRMLTAEVDGRARLEPAIDAALELAHSAVQHDDNVGLLVFADEILHFVPPARGRRALRRILDALAAIEGRLVEPDYPAAFAWLAARNRRRALTVCFTDVIDRTASDALLAQAGNLRPRHLPLVVTLRDPGLERTANLHAATVDEAFERAAAEELLEARESALADLRSRGVLVLDVAPERAAQEIVARYERLKRRAMV